MKPFSTAGRAGSEHGWGLLGTCQRSPSHAWTSICKINGCSRTNSGGAMQPSFRCLATPEATFQQFAEAPSAGIPWPRNSCDHHKQNLKSTRTTQQNAIPDLQCLHETGGCSDSGGGNQGGAGGQGGGGGWQPDDDNPFEDPDWVVSMLCVAAVPAAFELVQKCLHLDGDGLHRSMCYKPCFASVSSDTDEVRSYSKGQEHSGGGGGLLVVVGIAAAVGVSVAGFFRARKNRKHQAQEPRRPVAAGGEHAVVQSRGLHMAALPQPTSGAAAERTNETPAPHQADDAENSFLQAKKEKDAFFGVSSSTHAPSQTRPEGSGDVKAPHAPPAMAPKVPQPKPRAVHMQERAVGMDSVVQDTRSGNISTTDMESKDRFFGSPPPKVEASVPTDLDSKERFFGSPRLKVQEPTPAALDSKERFFGSPRSEAATEESGNAFLSAKEEKDAFFGVTSPTYAKGQLRPEGFTDVKAPASAPAVAAGVPQLKPEEVQVQEMAVGMDKVVQDTRSGNIFASDLDSKDNFFGSPRPKAAAPATDSAVQAVPEKKINVFLQSKEEKDAFFGVTSPTYAKGPIHPDGFGDVDAPAAAPGVTAEVVQVKPDAVQVQETATGMDGVVQDTRSGNIFTADLESKDRFFGSPRPKAVETPSNSADGTGVETAGTTKAAPEEVNTLLSAKEEKDAFFGVTSPTYAKGQLRPEGFDDVKAPASAPAVAAGVPQLKPEEVQVQERAAGMDKVVQDTRSGNIFASDLDSKDNFFGSPQTESAKAPTPPPSSKDAEQAHQKAAEPAPAPMKEGVKAAPTVGVHTEAGPGGTDSLKLDMKEATGAAAPLAGTTAPPGKPAAPSGTPAPPAGTPTKGPEPPKKQPMVVQATSMPVDSGVASKHEHFLQPVREEPADQEPKEEGPSGSRPAQTDAVQAQPQAAAAGLQISREDTDGVPSPESAGRSTPHGRSHRGRGRSRGGGRRGKKK